MIFSLILIRVVGVCKMDRRTFIGMTAVMGLSVSVFGNGSATAIVTLTEAQKASLLFMYQEEKVARDVYIILGAKYPNAATFANIAVSEQQHIDAVESLCKKYSVDISKINENKIGEFVLPELQTLYDTLVAKGSISLRDGLQVGVAIEEKDIIDILCVEVGMPADIVKVFENLRAGSMSHLSAFNNALSELK